MRMLLLLVAAVAFAQRPWPPPGLKCPERTVAILKVDPANASRIDQFYDASIDYFRALLKSGKILAAGPDDSGGGFVIFNSTDWAEIEAIMKKEPFTREGVTKIVSHSVWRACEAAP
jgi:uncharacterized protein YciI